MPYKEMHFFDVRHGDYGRKYYGDKVKTLVSWSRELEKRVEDTLKSMNLAGEENALDCAEARGSSPNGFWTDEVMRRFYKQARFEKYFRHVSKIREVLSIQDLQSYVEYVNRHGAGASAFGEITPTYCVLHAAAFAEMERALPDARFFYVMRDPVERLWSQARYKPSQAGGRGAKRYNPQKDFERTLARTRGGKLADYQHTIEALERAIPGDRIHYLFTETMTDPVLGPAEIRKVEKALGLMHREIGPETFKEPVNASPVAALDPVSEAAAVRVLEPIYRFVEGRFGRPFGWRVPADFR